MLSEALSFPRSGDDWLETVLVGGVLSLLAFLVLPAIVVNGYLLRVLRAAVEGDEAPPRFADWADLFVDGLLVLVVEVVYVGVPSMLLGLAVALTFGFAFVGRNVGALVVLVAGAVVLLGGYLLPAALANFARADEIAAAFDRRTVVRVATSVDYLVAVLLATAVSAVLGFVGGLLVVLLVGFFVLFYLQVVVYHLFGQGFARGLDLGPSVAGASDADR